MMLDQSRIESSKRTFRRLADKRGLAAHIPDARRPNKGRPLAPYAVIDFFHSGHARRKKLLNKAVDQFWQDGKKPRKK